MAPVFFPNRHRGRHAMAIVAGISLASLPCAAAAEKFAHLGTQPDGTELYVQASPPQARDDGRRAGWFRSVPKTAQPITDANGIEKRYVDMLAFNVADCSRRTMAAASLVYRDAAQAIVARFEVSPQELELRRINPNTLGEAMLEWLCAPKRPAAPAVPSAGNATPVK
jgi:hypothetical protein